MVAPLNTIADVAHDPHVIAREMFVDLPHPSGNQTLRVSNSPIRLSRTPVKVDRRPSNPGEDTVEILRSLGGFSEQEIADMVTGEVIGTAEHAGPARKRGN
jgi:crotonobetainyl-CoA:carnitine CoA-transferase CaiB-like acyl-CoA transferase